MKKLRSTFVLAFVCFAGSQLHATITAKLTAQLPSPQLIGTPIALNFSATDSNPGPVTFRLELAFPQSSTFQLVSDFMQKPSFTWTPNSVEGLYQLRLTARDQITSETSQVVTSFNVASRIVNNKAVVTATTHALIALFSAPNCLAGSSIRVTFQNQGGKVVNTTDSRACHSGSQNFYIVGMMPSTTYNMNYYVTTNGIETPGPAVLTFKTGVVPASFVLPTLTLPIPVNALTSQTEKFLLSSFNGKTLPIATDLKGNIVWYWPLPGPPQLNRPQPGGTILAIGGEPQDWTGTGVNGEQTKSQLLWELDYVGNIVRETNVDRVNEQLLALGTDTISHFNHEHYKMANGYHVTIGDIQRIYPAGTQGSKAPVDVIGTMLVVLNQDLQVVWTWDSFNYLGAGQLDINRPATLGETCPSQGAYSNDVGCPPVLLLPLANDWLHANSVVLAADGSFLVSLRHQDWLLKVNYANGTGDGTIVWKMGVDGNFTVLNSTDPYPWFSHQHEAAFQGNGTQILSVFDNGNLRVAENGGNSRGQVWSINEANFTATPVLNADLGQFSTALGSAQLLSNGDYVFGAGNIDPTGPVGSYTQSIEENVSATPVYLQQAIAPSYRSWRMTSFYAPPLN
jgi:hypothetical protein